MSQHDYDIANAAGATVRADLNLALAAQAGNNSGATAPATTFAYMWWCDTTTGLLKQRNAANSAWVTVGPLSLAAFGAQDVLSVAASATGCDIWAGGYNVNLTGGAVTFTNLAAAPQAGAIRRVRLNAAHVFTNNANLDVQGAANFTGAINDVVWVYAKTTTTFQITVERADGTPVIPPTVFSGAASVASAATCDIWSGAGTATSRHVTGTTAISSFGTAPRVGAWMTLIFDGAVQLTAGANLVINGGGSNVTVAANDMVIIHANSTTQMMAFVLRASGLPVTAPQSVNNILSADVALSNTTTYYDGPVISVDTSKKYFVSGMVVLKDNGSAVRYRVKLWDNTTVYASAVIDTTAAGQAVCVSLSGVTPTPPAAGIRISVRNVTATTGAIFANESGEGKDSQLMGIIIS